jgi:hypothetical protein
MRRGGFLIVLLNGKAPSRTGRREDRNAFSGPAPQPQSRLRRRNARPIEGQDAPSSATTRRACAVRVLLPRQQRRESRRLPWLPSPRSRDMGKCSGRHNQQKNEKNESMPALPGTDMRERPELGSRLLPMYESASERLGAIWVADPLALVRTALELQRKRCSALISLHWPGAKTTARQALWSLAPARIRAARRVQHGCAFIGGSYQHISHEMKRW